MKHLKMLGIAAVAAMSFLAFAASSASAVTLEVNGVTKNEPITISASIEPLNSAVLSRTDGTLANTCTISNVHGTTTVFTGQVTGPVSSLTFENCTRPVTVHKPGQLYIESASHIVKHENGKETVIPTPTNGTVFSENAEVTVGTPFGTVNCKTGTGTHIGVLTAATSALNATDHATMDINAVLNCGILLPSASWKGAYTVTSPTGLGVSA